LHASHPINVYHNLSCFCQVFGAYLSDTIQISDKFYGNGKSFLFRLAPSIEFFKWTAANSYVLMGNKDSLVVGGGG
jgi:hypothetical protein